MSKFIKENWFKIIVSFSILLISISAFYFLFILQQKNVTKIKFSNGKTVDFNGTPTQQDITDVSKKMDSQQSTPTDKDSQDREITNSWIALLPGGAVSKYGAEVLQTGGVGSRTTQKTAYLLTEQGYLKPPEDWVSASFNGPADIMDVDCKDGYAVTDCKVNGTETQVDPIFGCRAMPLKNTMQNKVDIECTKK